ncbi:unnamed protein product, partial [Prorocentrum cordatum]
MRRQKGQRAQLAYEACACYEDRLCGVRRKRASRGAQAPDQSEGAPYLSLDGLSAHAPTDAEPSGYGGVQITVMRRALAPRIK